MIIDVTPVDQSTPIGIVPLGPRGFSGWTPVLSIVEDASVEPSRHVHQVVDWIGVGPSKPETGHYVGVSGLVEDIEDAINLSPSDYYTQAQVDAGLEGKADADSLATVAMSGSYGDLQDRPTLGTAAEADVEDFATAAAGALAASAVQPSTPMDWSGGYVDAPKFSLPEIARRRYIDVGAYASLTDTDNAHAAIQAAFDAAEGREVVFTSPYGGKRYYRSTTRPAFAGATFGALIMPKRGRIISEPGAVLDFSSWANSGNSKYLLYANGAAAFGVEPPSVGLAADSAKGTKSISLIPGGGASFSRGWHIVVSNAFFTTEDGSLGTKGEWIYVSSVSTDTLQLTARLRDDYGVADVARVYPLTGKLCELSVEGLNILGPGQFTTDVLGDRGIGIDTGINCRVIGTSISRSDQLAVAFSNVLNGAVEDTVVSFDPKGTNTVNQYGIHLSNNCENTKITLCDVVGGKEATGLTGTGGIQGITRDCTISYNRMRGAWRGGFTTHDQHENILCEGNIIEDCEIGIDNRIVGGHYRSNTIRRTGTGSGSLDCALLLGSGAGRVIFENNVVEYVLRGVWLSGIILHETVPGDIDIINNDMRQVRSHGVIIQNTTGSTSECGTVTVEGNRIEGNGSAATRGVEIEGKWRPIIRQNSYRRGNSNRCVYLHATNNGAGSNGSISPVIEDERFDSTFTEPLIQHGSGRYLVMNNQMIGASALPTIASASIITVPTTGSLFKVTGTTGISAVNLTASYIGKEITLIFAASLSVTHNSGTTVNTIKLNGGANFSATADDTLTLVSDGNQWIEKARSAI